MRKVETERLSFIRMNQKKLRVDDYIHLRDAIAADGNARNLGKLVILPSSFTGSPRYMNSGCYDLCPKLRQARFVHNLHLQSTLARDF